MRNLLLIFFLFTLIQIVGQTKAFRKFSVEDGLSQSQVYAMLEDHNGYLWLGTRGGGLSKFDGKNFQSFNQLDGLPNAFIYTLLQDKNKNIWIGTNDGLCYYNGKKFKTIKVNVDAEQLMVFSLALDEKNVLWAGTNKGIFVLKNNELICMNKQLSFPAQSVNSILIDQSKLYAGGSFGFFEYNFSKKKLIQWKDKDRVMRNAITTIVKDKKGILWIGTYGDGLYCKRKNKFHRIDLKLELYKESVFKICVDKNDNLWIGTLTKGLVHYNRKSKQFTVYSEKKGLSNNHVRTVIQDKSGTIWVGTSGGGINSFNSNGFTHFTTANGLGANFIYSIFRDSKKRLWLGTGTEGVTIIEKEKNTTLNSSSGFEANKVKSIVEDNKGVLYFGTEGQGIGYSENGAFSWLKLTEKMHVKQLIKDRSGKIWATTLGAGILEIENTEHPKVLRQWKPNDGIISYRVTSMAELPTGAFVYGTESQGIGFFNPQTKQTSSFSESKGFPSNFIRCFELKNNHLFIGTAGDGIVLMNILTKKVIRIFSGKDGLISGNIYSLKFHENQLFVASERGLDVLQLNKQLKVISSKHYGKSDGFLGVETCLNSSWLDEDGVLWFGTINGLTRYESRTNKINQTPPTLSLEDVLLFYEPLSKTDPKLSINPWKTPENLILKHDQNHLSFLFKGINLSNPDGVSYSWKMEGFDPDWSPWTSDQRIVYSNLKSGDYTFKVRAKNEDGYVSKEPLIVKIQIETPFWLSTWFIILVSISGILLLWLAWNQQTKRIQKKALLAQEKVELSKNLIELEQKALRLQMNPHFIFNALNSIQGLIGTENETQARYYLAKFARLMRQILDNSKHQKVTLETEIATLENYLLIEQFCNANSFEYEIEKNIKTELNFIEIPPMLIQPFVENAIKHGFKNRENQREKAKISITFHEKEHELICSICDNGVGRGKAKENTSDFDKTHESMGVNVTEERLNLLEENERTKLKIIDLEDKNGNPTGTLVELTIPIL
jgi:ligand-binding sensor domain-containing protein/two-component sensor histidine kinase